MFKKLMLLVLGASFIGISYAGDRVDTLNELKPIEYCSVEARLFRDGMFSRNMDIPRVIRNVPEEIMAQLRKNMPVEIPTDAIYLTEWDSLNDREREFTEKLIFRGYDTADHMKSQAVASAEELPENVGWEGKITTILTMGLIETTTQKYFEACVQSRTKAGTMRSVLYRKIQGEHFKKPELIKDRSCETINHDASVIESAVMHQYSIAEIAAVAKEAVNISEGRKNQIYVMLEHLSEWVGTLEEWKAYWASVCGNSI